MYPELNSDVVKLQKPDLQYLKHLEVGERNLLIQEIEMRYNLGQSIDWEIMISDNYVGTCGIKYIDHSNNFGILKMMDNLEFTNQIGIEIIKLIINHSFDVMKLTRLEISVFPESYILIHSLTQNKFLLEEDYVKVLYSKIGIDTCTYVMLRYYNNFSI